MEHTMIVLYAASPMWFLSTWNVGRVAGELDLYLVSDLKSHTWLVHTITDSDVLDSVWLSHVLTHSGMKNISLPAQGCAAAVGQHLPSVPHHVTSNRVHVLPSHSELYFLVLYGKISHTLLDTKIVPHDFVIWDGITGNIGQCFQEKQANISHPVQIPVLREFSLS